MNSEVWRNLSDRLRRLGIAESDLVEQFVRSGGKGGQNVNKVSTCVLLTHRPSGISVRCEEERSQAQNRVLARKRLADKFEQRKRDAQARERHAVERIKRQKRKRSRGAKEQMLKNKHHRAGIKKNRSARGWDD
jgi:protein subunit release factor B